MRRTKALFQQAAAAICFLCLGLATSANDPSPKDTASKKATAAKAGDKKTGSAVSPGAKDDGRITIADWLDLGSKVVDAANELFAFRRPPVRVIAGPGAPPAPLPPDVARQFERQYAARFRQVYRSELHLMRLACQPSREQFDTIGAAGEADLKEAIKTCCAFWQRQRQRRPGPGENQPEVRKLIAAGIAKSVKATLSPEQATRYQQELDGREAARRQMVLSNIVANVDRKLVLTARQRVKLAEVFDQDWRPWWGQLLLRGGDAVPQIADDKVLPILCDTQKSVWTDVRKVNALYGFELDYFQVFEIGDEVWPVSAGDKK
jgi:hypothetical protein